MCFVFRIVLGKTGFKGWAERKPGWGTRCSRSVRPLMNHQTKWLLKNPRSWAADITLLGVNLYKLTIPWSNLWSWYNQSSIVSASIPEQYICFHTLHFRLPILLSHPFINSNQSGLSRVHIVSIWNGVAITVEVLIHLKKTVEFCLNNPFTKYQTKWSRMKPLI